MSTGEDFYDSNEYDDGYAESDILQPTYDWNGVQISPNKSRLSEASIILGGGANPADVQRDTASAAQKGRVWRRFCRAFREVRFAAIDSRYDYFPHRCPPPDLDSLCSTTKFNRKELQQMYRAFKQECPSGVISEGIFRLLLASLFPNGDTSFYAHLVFRAFDTRDLGFLGFEDFASMMSTICRGSAADKLRFVFRMYDIDGNGTIDRDELFQIITAVHKLVLPKKSSSHVNLLYHNLVERHVDRIWKKLDIENSGSITQDDFVRACLSETSIVESLTSLQDPESDVDSPGPSSSSNIPV